MTTTPTSLLVDRNASDIVTLTLNRPERRNALSRELIDAIHTTCLDLAADPTVRAVILTGAGGAFCAGLDLNELGDTGGNITGRFIEALRNLPHPTIAAIDGPAATAGIELALACDIRLGSPRARLADTHARVGVIPGGGVTVLLRQVVGYGRAMEMSLSGRFVDAREAADWGLLNRVVEGDVLAEAHALAELIAANPAPVVTQIRALIKDAANHSTDDALLREIVTSERYFETFDHRQVATIRESIVARGRVENSR